MTRALLSPDQAAKELCISAAILKRWTLDGWLKPVLLRTGKTPSYEPDEVEDFGRALSSIRDACKKGKKLLVEHRVDYPSGGGVYFVRSGDFVKIGYASNFARRLRSLQTAMPHDLTLVCWSEGGKADEQRLHHLFAHLRSRGEWFRLEGELLQYIHERTKWYWGVQWEAR